VELVKNVINTTAIKIIFEEGGVFVARAYLYLIKNDLHDKPYGLLEDVFVEEEYRQQGIGTEIVKKAIEEAKAQGCYKMICTSRSSNTKVHEWYNKLGFEEYGVEFRIELKG
jgi:GNAT superfamily N-acetyltransferase